MTIYRKMLYTFANVASLIYLKVTTCSYDFIQRKVTCGLYSSGVSYSLSNADKFENNYNLQQFTRSKWSRFNVEGRCNV